MTLVLSDGWPDGPPESRVHVAVEDAPNGDAATIIRLARDDLDGYLDELEEEGAELVATGAREWFRQSRCAECRGAGDDPS